MGAEDRHHAVVVCMRSSVYRPASSTRKARPLVIVPMEMAVLLIIACTSVVSLQAATGWSPGKSGSPAPLYVSKAARRNAVRRQYASASGRCDQG